MVVFLQELPALMAQAARRPVQTQQLASACRTLSGVQLSTRQGLEAPVGASLGLGQGVFKVQTALMLPLEQLPTPPSLSHPHHLPPPQLQLCAR